MPRKGVLDDGVVDSVVAVAEVADEDLLGEGVDAVAVAKRGEEGDAVQATIEGDKGAVGIDGVGAVHQPAGVAGVGGGEGVAVFDDIGMAKIVESVAYGAADGVDGVE